MFLWECLWIWFWFSVFELQKLGYLQICEKYATRKRCAQALGSSYLENEMTVKMSVNPKCPRETVSDVFD